jgi:orotidine-5'-phosphate decarboxylase
LKANERLIVAVDVPNDPLNPSRLIESQDAFRIIDQLDDLVSFFKIGWPLYLVDHGQTIASEFISRGKKVFLDLKYGDIPHTVQKLVATAASHGIDLLSLNASTEAVRCAVVGRDSISGTALKLLRITLLTSMDKEDLEEMGFSIPVLEFVSRMAKKAKDVGCDGVVCSGQEAETVRSVVGSDFLIVTPGIRPRGLSPDDHKRHSTPASAIRAGADYLVVGRPIMRAQDARAATVKILEEMQAAFDKRGF